MMSEPPGHALGLPADRAASLLPTDLLHGDEVIILLLKPSLLYIVLMSLESLVMLAVVVMAALWTLPWLGMDVSDTRSLVLLGVILGLIRLTWQFLQWLASVYVLTDRRIIRVRNFLRPEIFQTALTCLQHTEVLLSIRERLFGLGTIAFSTAGTAYPEAYWLMIRQPLAVHRQIVQAMNRARGNGRHP